MNKESKPFKPFAQSEREQIRELFMARARSPPQPNPLDADSMREWQEYVEGMRQLESRLLEAGEVL